MPRILYFMGGGGFGKNILLSTMFWKAFYETNWMGQLDASGHAIDHDATSAEDASPMHMGGGAPGELPRKILKSKLPESPFAAI